MRGEMTAVPVAVRTVAAVAVGGPCRRRSATRRATHADCYSRGCRRHRMRPRSLSITKAALLRMTDGGTFMGHADIPLFGLLDITQLGPAPAHPVFAVPSNNQAQRRGLGEPGHLSPSSIAILATQMNAIVREFCGVVLLVFSRI